MESMIQAKWNTTAWQVTNVGYYSNIDDDKKQVLSSGCIVAGVYCRWYVTFFFN